MTHSAQVGVFISALVVAMFIAMTVPPSTASDGSFVAAAIITALAAFGLWLRRGEV